MNSPSRRQLNTKVLRSLVIVVTLVAFNVLWSSNSVGQVWVKNDMSTRNADLEHIPVKLIGSKETAIPKANEPLVPIKQIASENFPPEVAIESNPPTQITPPPIANASVVAEPNVDPLADSAFYGLAEPSCGGCNNCGDCANQEQPMAFTERRRLRPINGLQQRQGRRCNSGCASGTGGYNNPQVWTSPIGHAHKPGKLDFMMKARNASDVSIDKPKKSHAYVNWEVYRDCEKYPTDPRKQCNDCVLPAEIRKSKIKAPGYLGRPYRDTEPGGCDCGKKKCKTCRREKKSLVNLYWPRPFSAKFDERNPDQAAMRYQSCQEPKCIDVFDAFEDFKLINYTRNDNGYRGDCRCRNNDPYGCLGESRQAERVFGIGARNPGDPVSPGNVEFDSSIPAYPGFTSEPMSNGIPTSNFPSAGYPTIDPTPSPY